MNQKYTVDDHDDAVRADQSREAAARRYEEEQVALWEKQFGNPNDPETRRKIERTARSLLRRVGLAPDERDGHVDPFRLGKQADPADVRSREDDDAKNRPPLGQVSPVPLGPRPRRRAGAVLVVTHPAFRRFLRCRHCSREYSLAEVYHHHIFKFQWDAGLFWMTCPGCRNANTAEVFDRLSGDAAVTIEIDGSQAWRLVDSLTGEVSYVWDMPDPLRDAVRAGNLPLLETCPLEVIRAVIQGRYFRFHPGVVTEKIISPPPTPDPVVRRDEGGVPAQGPHALPFLLQALRVARSFLARSGPELLASREAVQQLDEFLQDTRYWLAAQAEKWGGLTPELAPLVQSRSDDVAAQMRKLQLIQGRQLSTSGLKSIGLDYRDLVRREMEEQKFAAEEQAKLAREMERVE